MEKSELRTEFVTAWNNFIENIKNSNLSLDIFLSVALNRSANIMGIDPSMITLSDDPIVANNIKNLYANLERVNIQQNTQISNIS